MSRQTLNVLSKWLTLLGFFLFAVSSFAINGKTTYQAKIIKPDGQPLQSASVNFRFTVLDQSGSCAMYIEDYAAINMTDTGGLISFPLGTGARAFPTSGTAQTFQNTFDNSITSFACQAMGIYNPNPTDTRKIVMQFNDGGGWQTLPAMSINAVPYAMFATRSDNSKLLNNKADTAFVEYSTLAGLSCAADQAIKYNGVSFSCITVSSSTAVTSSAVIAALGYTPVQGASFTSLDLTLTSVSAAVYSVSSTVANLNGSVTSLSNSVTASFAAITSSQWIASGSTIYFNNYVGIGTSSPSANLSFGGTSGTQNITVDRNSSGVGAMLQLRAGGAAVNATDTNGGTLMLSAGISTGTGQSSIILRTTSGTVSGSSDNVLINRMVIVGNGNVGIGTNTPATKLDVVGGVKIGTESATCAAGLAGTLRYSGGAVEFCNGASWSAFGVAGAGITSLNSSTSGTQTFAAGITGTVFNISSNNGVHTFNVPLAASGSVVAGLLSNADYVTFTNKVSATSAAVISALGYTPASATGLGALASLNFLDLGSSLASGTLSAARLPTMSGDVQSSAGSSVLTLTSVGAGVTSGSQYTKVTVDDKGRVTSGAQLSSGDVTTALGFTPANTSVYPGNATATWTDVELSAKLGFTASTTSLYSQTQLLRPDGYNANVSEITGQHVSSLIFNTYDHTGYGNNGVFFSKIPFGGNFKASGTIMMAIRNDGTVGVGVLNPTAKMHLSAGAASMAPLKLTSGTLLSSPQSGTIEYDGANFYLTDGTNTRKAILTDTGGNYAVSHLTSSGNITFTPNSSVIVSSTTNSTSSNTGAFIVKGGMGVGADLNVAGIISGSSIVKATGYRANQGAPNSADSSTNGYSFGLDGDTGLFSPGTGGANGVVAIYNNNVETMRINPGAVGIGTSSPSAVLQLATATQNIDRIRLTGQEFYQAGNTDSVDGVSLLLGTNRSGNRQLWIADSAGLAQNTSNTVIRINPNSRDISAFATDGVTSKTLSLNSTGGYVGIGNVSPVAPLTVGNSSDRRGYVQLRDDGTNGPVLQLYNATSGGRIYNIYSGFSASGTFDISDLTAGNISRLTITASGNVGIGTVTPQRKLHIASANSSDGLLLDNGTTDSSNLIFHDSTQVVSGVTWNLDSANGAFRIFTEPITVVNPLTSISGNERLTILPSGNVGIGTSLPLGSLDVIGNQILRASSSTDQLNFAPEPVAGDGAKIYVVNSAQNAYQPLEIEGSKISLTKGNVGIGTTNPNYLLHMKAVSGAMVSFQRTDSVTPNGWMYAMGTSGASETFGTAIQMYNGELRFLTDSTPTDTINNLTQNFTMTSTGYVGIGTSAPVVPLDVKGWILSQPSAANNAGLQIVTSGTKVATAGHAGWVMRGIDTVAPYNGNVGGSLAYEYWNGVSVNQAMALTASGNVGIGTTSPIAKLDVNDSGTAIDLATIQSLPSGANSGFRYAFRAGMEGASNSNAIAYGGRMLATNLANQYLLYGYRSDNGVSTANIKGNGDGYFAGKVGVGTTTPTNKFEVRGGDTFIEGKAYVYSNSGWGVVTPAITLALGDQDTGFNWVSDGEFQVYANNQPRMHFDVSGNTGVGTTDPQYSLDVAGNFRVGGQAYTNTGAATFTVLSDVRYKDVHGNYERGLNDLLKVETIRFNYKKENPLGSDPVHEYIGLSAQNLQTAIPEAVEQQNKKGVEFLTVNTSPVIYTMINAIKEIYYKIVGHDREIASLKAKNEELESKLKEFDELKAYICKKDPQAPNCK